MSVYLRREVNDTKESSLIRRSINKAGVTSLFALNNISTDLCSLRVVFAKGYEQSSFQFRDSEGKEKQASESEIDFAARQAL